ncbi:hypothetical protein DFH07DRAFT_781074 [Mycena maculata]|uniref:Uncharacterized protein n=1 Tax=Mycena maculata TaxID=230809 RepID=A0AAD7I024_9AGAR|nr:hypothetical protein DFH07DRAFT_781074 [Mycena maculata]
MVVAKLGWRHPGSQQLALATTKLLGYILQLWVDRLYSGFPNRRFRAHFFGLCTNLVNRIEAEGWWKTDRTSTRVTLTVVQSVYAYDSKIKGKWNPMLADLSAVGKSDVTISKAALMLQEGILIQGVQSTIRELVRSYNEQPLATTMKDIKTRRTKAVERIVRWRVQQTALIPTISPLLLDRKPCEIEEETLYLPSDFECDQRGELGLSSWGQEEVKLHEAMAYDALKKVQLIVHALIGLDRNQGRKERDSQSVKTASMRQVDDTKRRRNKHMNYYMLARAALMKLGACTGLDDNFPALTEADTYMPSRSEHRAVGSSRIRDGWTAAGVMSGGKIQRSVVASVPVVQRSMLNPGATVMPAGRKAGPSTTKAQPKVLKEKPICLPGPEKKKRSGWLWTFGKMGKMSKEEMKAWSAEGDRVQWFRAEADMIRWQEQIEQKLAELRTTIRSFAAYKDAWTKMASIEEQAGNWIGYVAYAKQKADMWALREGHARGALKTYPEYACLEADDADLHAFIVSERAVHAKTLEAVMQSARAAAPGLEEESEEAEAVEEDEPSVVN